jgi:hypothetical protein
VSSRPRSLVAVALASWIVAGPAGAAVGDAAQARPPQAEALAPADDSPTPAAPQPPRIERPSHARAWLALGAGVALTGLSFVFAQSADLAYADYQHGTVPGTLGADYDRAVRNDRWASATLLTGQVALALGLYWRFVRHPRARRADSGLEGQAPSAPGQSLALRWERSRDGRGARLGLALEF